nr:hypothetical protein [Tanacetum cinerariifolium]
MTRSKLATYAKMCMHIPTVYFLHTKDEAPDMIINFINQIQVNLRAIVQNIRTDNETEFKNDKLKSHYEKLDITQQFSIARTLQQNELESSSTTMDPSNMHEFHQMHRSTDKWMQAHLLEQVIGDPAKPVMTRSKLIIDAKICVYALNESTIELKNIKKSMMDYRWIESMQDKMHQFKRLNGWELVVRPVERNIIACAQPMNKGRVNVKLSSLNGFQARILDWIYYIWIYAAGEG